MTARQRYAAQLGWHLFCAAGLIVVSVVTTTLGHLGTVAAAYLQDWSRRAEARARWHQERFWGTPEPKAEPMLRRVK